jgi:hypothetical protein
MTKQKEYADKIRKDTLGKNCSHKGKTESIKEQLSFSSPKSSAGSKKSSLPCITADKDVVRERVSWINTDETILFFYQKATVPLKVSANIFW